MNPLIIYIVPGIIMAFFYVYLFFELLFPAFLLNLVVGVIFYILITKDLKDSDNHKYYLVSIFLTALVFIFSTTNVIAYLLLLFEKLFLSELILALFLVWGFAHVVALVFEFVSAKQDEKKKPAKRKKKKKVRETFS